MRRGKTEGYLLNLIILRNKIYERKICHQIIIKLGHSTLSIPTFDQSAQGKSINLFLFNEL